MIFSVEEMNTKSSNDLKNAYVEGKRRLQHLRSATPENRYRIKEVSQRLDDIGKELSKRMHVRRNETERSRRLLTESFDQNEEFIRQNEKLSLSEKSNLRNANDMIRKMDRVHQKYARFKIGALQNRFSSIKKNRAAALSHAKGTRIENFDTLEEATQRVAQVETQLDDMRERASAYLTELNAWRNRATNISNGLAAPQANQQALHDLEAEHRRQVHDLNQEITILRVESAMIQRELEESENETNSLRERARRNASNTRRSAFPRNFIDPITLVGITEPVVCDDDGFCFSKTSIDSLFALRGRNDGTERTVSHPMTRERMTRDQFVDAPNFMDVIKEAIPEATPGNIICPITKQIITDPVCTLDGECFEEEAVNELFRKANEDGVSAVHPVTGDVLKRGDFLSNPNWKRVLAEYKKNETGMKSATENEYRLRLEKQNEEIAALSKLVQELTAS